MSYTPLSPFLFQPSLPTHVPEHTLTMFILSTHLYSLPQHIVGQRKCILQRRALCGDIQQPDYARRAGGVISPSRVTQPILNKSNFIGTASLMREGQIRGLSDQCQASVPRHGAQATPVVGDDDDRVHVLAEALDALKGLSAPPPALKAKRVRHHPHRQNACRTGRYM